MSGPFLDHYNTGASGGIEEVPCNLCGAIESVPLYTLQDNGYKTPGEFVLRRCLRCGLMYLSPRPTRETMAAYYPAEYAPYQLAVEDELQS